MEIRQRKAKTLHTENETLDASARESSTNKWLRKLESLAWVALAYGIAYFTNLIDTLVGLDHGMAFYLATGCGSCFILLFIFVVYIRPVITGKQVDLSQWELETPKAIYTATFLGLVSFLSTVKMLWPVFHIFSFPIVILELTGLIAFIGLF